MEDKDEVPRAIKVYKQTRIKKHYSPLAFRVLLKVYLMGNLPANKYLTKSEIKNLVPVLIRDKFIKKNNNELSLDSHIEDGIRRFLDSGYGLVNSFMEMTELNLHFEAQKEIMQKLNNEQLELTT